MVSTAFHWSVRGRQLGDAASDCARAGKYGLFWPRVGSLSRLVRVGMPPFWTYVFMFSVLISHLMKSAAADPFFEPFGIPSSQLPIMPRPLPPGPFGIGMYPILPTTWETPCASTTPVTSAGHVVDWNACPIAINRSRSAASMFAAPGSAYFFSVCVRNVMASIDSVESSLTFQLVSKMSPPNDQRMGSESLLAGLVALPRITYP